MAGRRLTPKEALELVPQREPFRFVDEIHALDEAHATGSYRWRPDADFFRGHFPGDPVTPGVLLVECMAQCGVVPMALFLFHLEDGADRAAGLATLFTDASVDFTGVVRPGDRVRVESERVFYRRRKLRVRAEMSLEDGTVVCSGQLSGIGVPR
jgi:3-hydroxyacyl-[acyl-carrier-protein] dehydratase